VLIQEQSRAVAGGELVRGDKTPRKRFAGNRCVNRWDDESWDTVPHKHGRFTIIVDRENRPLYSDKPDAWLVVPSEDYSA